MDLILGIVSTIHDGTEQDWTVLHGIVSLSVLSRVGKGE